MKKNILLILIVPILGILFYCDKKENITEPIRYGSIKGIIYKAQTEIPIAGAKVSIDDIFYTTGSDGYYELKNITVGRKILKVEKTNFETYKETVTINEGLQSKNIYLISLLKQKLYGKVLNSEGNPIEDATVKIGQNIEKTNQNGEYEFLDLVEGNYKIDVEHEYYEKYENSFSMPEGEKKLDIHLVSLPLPQVTSVSLSNRNYSIYIDWPDINLPTVKGYNIYYCYYLAHTLEAEIQGNYIYPIYSQWEKANQNVLYDSEYLMNSENYNTKYGIYILPVNIDGIETEFSNTKTVIKYIKKADNYNFLGEFSLTDSFGPITIPNDNNEMAIYLYFFISQPGAFNPNSWKVEVSTDQINWYTIGKNGIGVFGNYVPKQDAGYIKHFSLNQYKGKSIYFRTNPTTCNLNCLKIKNVIREYIY